MKRTFTDEQLKIAATKSYNFQEIAEYLGFKNDSPMRKEIKLRIIDLDINISHFKKTKRHISYTYDEIFCINSIKRSVVKNFIIKNDLISYECQICKITHYNNQPLSLQLDHNNGINNDNRLENLRFLCANCHSQTDNYCKNTVTRNKK